MFVVPVTDDWVEGAAIAERSPLVAMNGVSHMDNSWYDFALANSTTGAEAGVHQMQCTVTFRVLLSPDGRHLLEGSTIYGDFDGDQADPAPNYIRVWSIDSANKRLQQEPPAAWWERTK
jgi:hypothetical protein